MKEFMILIDVSIITESADSALEILGNKLIEASKLPDLQKAKFPFEGEIKVLESLNDLTLQ